MTNEEIAKAIRRANRRVCRMPKGGVHSTKKGKRGYTRKRKHAHR